MTIPADSMELVEIVARALAEDEGVSYDKYSEFFGETARIILAAIEASGRRIVPVELTTAMVNAYVDAVVMDDKGPRPLTEVAPERWAAFLSASPKVTT